LQPLFFSWWPNCMPVDNCLWTTSSLARDQSHGFCYALFHWGILHRCRSKVRTSSTGLNLFQYMIKCCDLISLITYVIRALRQMWRKCTCANNKQLWTHMFRWSTTICVVRIFLNTKEAGQYTSVTLYLVYYGINVWVPNTKWIQNIFICPLQDDFPLNISFPLVCWKNFLCQKHYQK
jgi:hypothetical protein